MKYQLWTLLALVCLAACGQQRAEQNKKSTKTHIPVIGLKSIQRVDAEKFNEQLSSTFNGVTTQVSNVLENYEEVQGMPWELTRVSVGFGIEAEADVLEVLEAELEANFELRFQKR